MGDYAKRMGIKARRNKRNAKKEILKDDARGFRARVANAKRIKGETTAKKVARGFAKNPGDLGKLIESQQKKKPY